MSTYAILGGDFFEASIRYKLDGQTCINTYHYQYDGSAPVITDGYTAVEDWLLLMNTDAAGLFKTHRKGLTKSVKYVEMRMQRIYAVRTIYQKFDMTGSEGQIIGDAGPSVLSAAISRRVLSATRGAQGRVMLSGMPTVAFVDGLLTPTAKTDLTAHANFLKASWMFGVTANALKPVVFHRASPTASFDVFSVQIEDSARAMRRRTVGRGI